MGLKYFDFEDKKKIQNCRYLFECIKEQPELQCPEYFIDCPIYKSKITHEVLENDKRFGEDGRLKV